MNVPGVVHTVGDGVVQTGHPSIFPKDLVLAVVTLPNRGRTLASSNNGKNTAKKV